MRASRRRPPRSPQPARTAPLVEGLTAVRRTVPVRLGPLTVQVCGLRDRIAFVETPADMPPSREMFPDFRWPEPAVELDLVVPEAPEPAETLRRLLDGGEPLTFVAPRPVAQRFMAARPGQTPIYRSSLLVTAYQWASATVTVHLRVVDDLEQTWEPQRAAEESADGLPRHVCRAQRHGARARGGPE